MCVTFTGCELLCSETVNWQQKSHATLKSKLRVQIKMRVMKERNARPVGTSFESSPWATGIEWGCLVFPGGVRKATDQGCKLLERRPRTRSSPSAPRPGRTRNRSRSLCAHSPPSGRRGVWGPQADGSRSQKVTRWLLYDSGEKPSAKRVSPPGKAEGGSHVRHWA